jgi:hypothetical protein
MSTPPAWQAIRTSTWRRTQKASVSSLTEAFCSWSAPKTSLSDAVGSCAQPVTGTIPAGPATLPTSVIAAGYFRSRCQRPATLEPTNSTVELRECRHCHNTLPLSEFDRRPGRDGDHLHTCNPCRVELARARKSRMRRDSSTERQQRADIREGLGHKHVEDAPDPAPARLLARTHGLRPGLRARCDRPR